MTEDIEYNDYFKLDGKRQKVYKFTENELIRDILRRLIIPIDT